MEHTVGHQVTTEVLPEHPDLVPDHPGPLPDHLNALPDFGVLLDHFLLPKYSPNGAFFEFKNVLNRI